MFIRPPTFSKQESIMKKNTKTPNANTEPVVNNNATSPEMKPGDELQIYYNDAYMRERQRLNDIFGVIEGEPVVEKEVVVEPDMSDFVHVSEYKKMKRRAAALGVFTAIFAIATVVLVVLKVLAK